MFESVVNALRPYQLQYRLINPIVPQRGNRTCKVFGSTMTLDLEDIIQRRMYIGCYERDETKAMGSVLKPGGVMVDIGANVGYFTALAASIVGPTGKIFAVEPNPTVYSKLQSLVRQNNLSHVLPFQMGLSDKPGTLTLYQPADHSHNESATMMPSEDATAIEVEVDTLDRCLDRWQIDKVDLLKIDVEGHESRVFAGATESFAKRRIGAILCEFNNYWLQRSGSSAKLLWQQLLSAGFRPADRSVTEPTGELETYLLLRD